MPFARMLTETAIPKELGKIIDIAPIREGSQPIWLMLAESGTLYRLNASTFDWARLGSVTPVPEPDHKPWSGHTLKHRLHVSPGGEFAAVVNDYGRFGQVIDLQSGTVTMRLDGGEYHSETVPFSFTFLELKGRTVAIHRTAWNRLDISDPSNGELLTPHGPANRQGGQRPQISRNLFHGALYASPGNIRVLDDGWSWAPTGMVALWELSRWQPETPWESEDGPAGRWVCGRDYYWDHGMAWISEQVVAVGGVGDDDLEMIDGARIFDITSTGGRGPRWNSDYPWPREVIAFAGPAGKFFSDGKWLYCSDQTGLSRWDPQNGTRIGKLDGFYPTHHHSGACQLVQLTDSKLVHWSTMDNPDSSH